MLAQGARALCLPEASRESAMSTTAVCCPTRWGDIYPCRASISRATSARPCSPRNRRAIG